MVMRVVGVSAADEFETISPPPASASSGRVRASHVHQPTGAAVATSPQKPSSTMVVTAEPPKPTSARAITASSSGMAISVRYRLYCRKRSIRKVPTKPATPNTSNISESVAALTCVTVSRNGRR